jgi:hypothetical protein
MFAFARFALHVVDRVFVPNVGVKAKDHAGSGFPFQDARQQGP